MRKLFAFLLLAGIFIAVFSEKVALVANSLLLTQPALHKVEPDEWLSKMAQKYYGDASYWKELALVNRAPNPDLILPGERIFIPSFEAIQRIRASRTISGVQSLVMEQEVAFRESGSSEERVATAPTGTEPAKQQTPAEVTDETSQDADGRTGAAQEPPAIPESPANGTYETMPSQAESTAEGLPWVWIIAGTLSLIGLGGLVLYRRRRAQQEEVMLDAEPLKDDRMKGRKTETSDPDIFSLGPSRNRIQEHTKKPDSKQNKTQNETELIHPR